jgi:hypothetical protein
VRDSAQASHVEVLLPAIGSREAERVMLSKEHWKLLARLLRRRKPDKTSQTQHAAQSDISPLRVSNVEAKRSLSPIDAAVAVGVGSRLYLLDCGKLYVWATHHWNSLAEMEAVCDAFRHNWKAWSENYRNDWSVPEHFFDCQEQLAKLRERAARERGEKAALAVPCATSSSTKSLPSEHSGGEYLSYALLLESVLFTWNDSEQLMAHAERLRLKLRQGTLNLEPDLRPRRILELIEMRLHALFPAGGAVLRTQKQPASKRSRQRQGPPPGCPEWPVEAQHPATVALGADSFFHTTGMLGFMGYSVGKKSMLTADRRRAILAYVFLGALPLVNDRHYMQEWGKPKTERRLRKLANSLAAFARNARRKQTSSWQQAIANWEADLAYLKKRFYDRRSRDWKWPEVVRRSRR